MLRIGEFSNLAKATVKTLRFYEEKGLLIPARVDEWTGYRYYESEQLVTLTKILALRTAGLSVAAIGEYLKNENNDISVLELQRVALKKEINEAKSRLINLENIIKAEKEKTNMSYEAVIKEIPEYTVYYKRGKVKDFSEIFPFVLGCGEECKKMNPDLECHDDDYCYVSYLDEEFTPVNMTIEYAEAVKKAGIETDNVKFRTLPKAKAVCVMHRGSYDKLPEAYAFAMKYVKENGYTIAAVPRERYIDGCWNKENEEDWLTEIEVIISENEEEAKDKYGETSEYKESAEKHSKMTAGEEVSSVRAAEKIFSEFAAIREKSPECSEAQATVKKWQEHITKYHYNCTKEILSSLAEMYVGDERFKENIDLNGKGTAQFMADAIKIYCK